MATSERMAVIMQNAKRKIEMGLNIASQGGDFDPYVKYNGKAGRWYVKQDDQEIEVQNPTFVADFENIKTGWFFFKVGSAPEKIFDKSLSDPVPKPDRSYVDDKGVTRDSFKRGFELRLFSKNSFGGEGITVLNGASMHLNNAINAIYEQYEKEAANNPGQLPVVACNGTTAMKDKHGTNYSPNLSILKWVPRPAELAGNAKALAESKETAPAASNPPVKSSVSEF